MYYNSRTNELKRFFSDLLEKEGATNDIDRFKQMAFDVEDILDELQQQIEDNIPAAQQEYDAAIGSHNSYLRWKNGG